jgi:hypothetical protein
MGALTYSGTAASNTTVDGIGAAGSDSPDNIDNLVRALAASDANLVKDLGGFNTVAGTADAITITLADASDNATTSPTLNVDSVGAEPIKKAEAGVETALLAGDIQGGDFYLVRWRSTWDGGGGAWELLQPYYSSNPTVIGGSVTYDGAAVPLSQINVTSSVALGLSRWANAPTSAQIRFAKSRGAAVNTRGVVQSGDTIADITFAGDDGTNFIRAASITASVDGTPGTNDMPGRLVFSTTADGGSSVTERLAIKADGSWNIAAVAGSNGQVIKQTSGATAWGSAATLVTASSATGTSIPYTNIPSWVRQIIISFYEVSLSGTDDILVQIGDAGGI